MIILINGTYGVGKTTVALKLKERLLNDEAELLESDVVDEKGVKDIVEEAKKSNGFPHTNGTLPQNSKKFIQEFRKIAEEKSKDSNKKLILDMALTTKESKEGIYDYLINANRNIVHIILTANEETIISRIKNDNERQKEIALDYLKENLTFLENNFNSAIRIKTDNRSVSDITDDIITIVHSVLEQRN